MKKSLLIITAVFMCITGTLTAQDLNGVLEKYFETVGLEKLKSVNSITMKGTAMQMGMEFPIVMQQKRPNMFRMDIEIQGTKITQAFDGTNGWAIVPMMGTLDPQDMTDDQVKSFKQMADFEGDLYNWEKKGFDVTLLGLEDMEGSDVYKIKIVKADGDEFLYYIDSEYFVLLRTDSKILVQGTAVESTSNFSNYKPQDGMMMFYKMETRMNGQVVMQADIKSYEFNLPMENSLFTKPVSSN
jgi:hypothetical protein